VQAMRPGRSSATRRTHSALRHYGPVAGLVLLGCLMVVLTVVGTTSIAQGPGNLALNAGVEILTTLITVAVVAPLVRRNQDSVIKLHSNLNFRHFIEQSARARRQVQVFSTFADLLQIEDTDIFLGNVRSLLERGGHVDFLLLHPDSLTTEQRQRELRGVGTRVSDLIIGNIHTLNEFKSTLPEVLAQNLSMRLYDASASIIMYRWDDRSLISFLAPDRLAEEGTHLEIDMRSPIGAFVDARFFELWSQPRTMTLEQYMALSLTFVSDKEGWTSVSASVSARYVIVEGAHYVDSSPVLVAQALHPDQVLRAHRTDDHAARYDLVLIDPDDSPIREVLAEAFRLKYRDPVRIFVHLRPDAIG